jgi:hypothetical protein
LSTAFLCVAGLERSGLFAHRAFAPRRRALEPLEDHGRFGTRGTNRRHVCSCSGRSGSFVELRMIQMSTATSQIRAIGKRITTPG